MAYRKKPPPPQPGFCRACKKEIPSGFFIPTTGLCKKHHAELKDNLMDFLMAKLQSSSDTDRKKKKSAAA